MDPLLLCAESFSPSVWFVEAYKLIVKLWNVKQKLHQ